MITFFTLVLDGMPWIERHYPVFKSLKMDWSWFICEGVAANTNCTAWCDRIRPRLSKDGTSEYLYKLWEEEARISVFSIPLWEGGKVEMCNTALKSIAQPCLLWQVDSDEIWTAAQIEAVVKLFEQHPERNCAYFWCRYFVGPDIVILGRDSWSNNPAYEWKRVWRFTPGMQFARHEPPTLAGVPEVPLTHAETEAVGAVFDHYAYATLPQVRFKQQYYAGERNPNRAGYLNLETNWLRLQENQQWPARLKDYMPFVPEETMVTRIKV